MTKKYKILCIDDEKEILDLYGLILDEQYDILKVQNPADVFKMLQIHANEIIYIFSDYLMPEMNGFEIREKILNQGHEIPFAIVTGNYTIEMATKAMELRISSFINKPIEDMDLFKLISDLGEKRKQQINEEKEMVCAFIGESSGMLEEIESLILQLEENPKDTNALNTYFRLLHTIKGTASCVGLKSLPKFAHAYEDLISKAREEKISINTQLIAALLFGLDKLKFMYNEINTGSSFEFEIAPWIDQLSSAATEKNEASDKATSAVSQDQKKGHTEKLAIPIETLDSFLELNGKLTIIRNAIFKALNRVETKYTNDKDIETLSASIEEMQKVTSSIQKQITEMRKVTSETITRPLKRVIRDVSKDLNKDVHFTVINEHLKIDNSIAKIVSNSLVHLVRNSIDHGIEKPETRIQNGKSAAGKIELTFIEDGDNNIVTITDDGAGINKDAVIKKAIDNKLISPDDKKYISDEDIYALIFEPGFSTAQNVSDLSGRGVGMDMVKSSVESIGGKITINSRKNLGTSFKMTLPQPKSVLINKTLMVEENSNFFSIPIDDIIEVVKVEKDNFSTSLLNIANSIVLKRYDDIIPVIKLDNALKQNSTTYLEFLPRDAIIIITKNNNQKMGIWVDNIFDIEESVVRKVRHVTESTPIFNGVTYFGDDNLALILNVNHIMKENLVSSFDSKKIEMQSNVHNLTVTSVMKSFFTFTIDTNKYAIEKDYIFRVEIFQNNLINHFQGNYFIKYREQILKVITIKNKEISHHHDNDNCNAILIKLENQIIALRVDQFHEFIDSDFPIENSFNIEKYISGTIIHEEEIVRIIDENFFKTFLQLGHSPVAPYVENIIDTEDKAKIAS